MFGALGRIAKGVGRGLGKALDIAADLARGVRGLLPGKSKQVADAVIAVDEAVDKLEGEEEKSAPVSPIPGP